MSLISCRHVTLSYEGHTVVHDLSFTAEPGDFLCIVGENGSGKTTLMKALLGLKSPAGGEIACGGGRRRGIGWLPQQTAAQRDFPATVREVVLSGCLPSIGLMPFYPAAARQRAADEIARLQLGALQNRSFRDLSVGQQRRVLLARALCAADELLLLDEPAAGLDPLVTAEFYALIEKLNREDHMTVLMVTHDIPAAVRYGRTILHLGAGGAFFGSTADYLASPAARLWMTPGTDSATDAPDAENAAEASSAPGTDTAAGMPDMDREAK